MNKREFLSQLQDALMYELPPSYVESNLNYYSGYINEEMRKGRSQEEVLEELGDPKLIARSIIDAIKSGADGLPGTADDISFTGPGYAEDGDYRSASDCNTFDEQGNRSCEEEKPAGYGSSWHSGRGSGWQGTFRQMDLNGGCGCLGLIILFLLIMSVIGWLIGVLSPILAPICMVLLIIWLLKRISDH